LLSSGEGGVMGSNSEGHRRALTYNASCSSLPWLLAILTGLLVGYLVASPRLSLLLLGLVAGVVMLLFCLPQYVCIPAFRIEKLCCYLVFIAAFFGVALFAIDLGPLTLFPYRILLVLLWGLFVARVLTQGKVALPQGRIRPYMTFFAIWVAYAVVSLGWAASKGGAVRHVIFLAMGVSLIFFATYYFRDHRDLAKLYWIWFGVFCSLILLGLWEHLTGHHLPVSGYYGEAPARFMHCPTGVFKNPNDYATFLSLSIPFAIYLIRYNKCKLVQLGGFGGAATAFYLIVATGSRANLLAVLLELGFLLLFLTGLKQKTKVAATMAVCVAIAFVVLPGAVRESSLKVAAELSSIATQAELGIGSVAVRANLARNGLQFLYSTAGFGVGAGNAEYWMARFARHDTAGILNLHNWWLEVLVNYGVLIFGGYVAVYIGIVRDLWHVWRRARARGERVIAEAVLVSMVAFAVASMSSSSIMAFNPNWILFALALVLLNHERRGLGMSAV